MTKVLVFLACAMFIFAFVHHAHAEDESDDHEYGRKDFCSIESSFIWNVDGDNAQQFLQKRLFGIPFPREQRREAKEKYEERFEDTELHFDSNEFNAI